MTEMAWARYLLNLFLYFFQPFKHALRHASLRLRALKAQTIYEITYWLSSYFLVQSPYEQQYTTEHGMGSGESLIPQPYMCRHPF